MSDQRKFNVVGKNLILLSNMLLNNQKLCKLLYYSNSSPLSQPDFDTEILFNKNIRVIPKAPDFDEEKGSFVIVLLDQFIVDPGNIDVKLVEIRIDVICPMDEWSINEESLRPFLIMSEIQSAFDGIKINGIGKLNFLKAERIVLSETHAGYSMTFNNYEFN